MARLQLEGSVFKFEDLWAAENWVTATISKSGTYDALKIESQATLENGMAIQIDGFDPLNGFWYITNYDLQNGEFVEINEFLLKNSKDKRNAVSTQQEVQIRIIPLLQSCKISGGSVDFGKVNVNQTRTGYDFGNACYGRTQNIVSGFECFTQGDVLT